MTTEERLETLERELARAKRRNRRLPAAARLVAGAFALVCIVAAAGCNSFVLVDENGKPRIMLAVIKAGPVLSLIDENGEDRAILVVGKHGPKLAMLDENGKPRAMLAVDEVGPMLAMLDENGKHRASLVVDKDGPRLRLLDENGKLKWAAP